MPEGIRHKERWLSQRAHRQLIGVLGLLLPALIWSIAGLFPTTGLEPTWAVLTSVSAYYYTAAVAVFVGVLFALSLFLFTYPGYEEVSADRIWGRIGGTGALGVALFPTAAPNPLTEPSWWEPWMRTAHYVSAATLFVSFIVFSIWLFRLSSFDKREERPRDKIWRDDICLACGIAMIVFVLWAASAMFTHAPIFLPEALAIIAFAISWLVKGEAHDAVFGAMRRLTRRGAN